MEFRFQERFATTTATEAKRTDLASGGEVEAEIGSPFGRLRNRLLRYLVSVGVPVHEGEEIVQDAFLSLFRHVELKKPRTNFDAWLFRVTHNLVLKRRAQIRKSLEVLNEPGLSEDCASDPSPNAEVNLVNFQTQERLRSILEVCRSWIRDASHFGQRACDIEKLLKFWTYRLGQFPFR